MEQLIKQEKKFKNLVELYADDLKNKKDVDLAFQKYQYYINKLNEVQEEIYRMKMEEASAKPKNTMDEEKERLTLLVSIIKERKKGRKKLIDNIKENVPENEDEYLDITEDETTLLDEYTRKISLINEYVQRKNEIISLEEKINIDSIQLEEATKIKEQNTIFNENLELELNEFFFESFKNIEEISKEEDKNEISLLKYEGLIKELLNLQEKNLKELNGKVKRSKNKTKVQTELETKQKQIEETKLEHFNLKERIYLLSIIKLLATKDTEYQQMIEKRKNISQLLNNRNKLIKKYKLEIENEKFHYLELKVKEQYELIKEQEQNIKLIDKLTTTINKTNDEKGHLEQLNNQEEYAKIREEFKENTSKEVEVDTNIVPPYEEIEFPIWKSERPTSRQEIDETTLQEETISEPQEEVVVEEEKQLDEVEAPVEENEIEKILKSLEIEQETKFQDEITPISPAAEVINEENPVENVNQEEFITEYDDQEDKLVNDEIEEIVEKTKEQETTDLEDTELEHIMAYIQSISDIPVKMNKNSIITKGKNVLKQIAGMFKKDSFTLDKDGNIVDPTVKRRTLE